MAQPTAALVGVPGRFTDTWSPPDEDTSRAELVTVRTSVRLVLEQIRGHHPIVRAYRIPDSCQRRLHSRQVASPGAKTSISRDTFVPQSV